MTGPETKILTGYGSVAQQHAKPGEVPPTTSGGLSITLIISRLLQHNQFLSGTSGTPASVVLLIKGQVCTQFLQLEVKICLVMYE